MRTLVATSLNRENPAPFPCRFAAKIFYPSLSCVKFAGRPFRVR